MFDFLVTFLGKEIQANYVSLLTNTKKLEILPQDTNRIIVNSGKLIQWKQNECSSTYTNKEKKLQHTHVHIYNY